MASLIDLPNELLKRVVDHVAVTDNTGLFVSYHLLNLILSHSHFFLLAEDYVVKHKEHLKYRFVVIGHAEDGQDSEWLKRRIYSQPLDLLLLIHEDPSIVAYIRSLRYQVRPDFDKPEVSAEVFESTYAAARHLVSFAGFIGTGYSTQDYTHRILHIWAEQVALQDPLIGSIILLSLLPRLECLSLQCCEHGWFNNIGMLTSKIRRRTDAFSRSLQDPGSLFMPLANLERLQLNGVHLLSDALSYFTGLPKLAEVIIGQHEYILATGFAERTGIKTIIMTECHCHRANVLKDLLVLFPGLERLICYCTGKLIGRREKIYRALIGDREIQERLKSMDMQMSFARVEKGCGFAFKRPESVVIQEPSK